MKAESAQGYSAHSLHELPELQVWQDHPETAQLLADGSQGRLSAFVQAVTRLVAARLPSPKSDAPISPGLKQLYRQGYTPEQLAQSLAYAWLTASEYLYLPQLQGRRLESPWLRQLPPALVSLFILIKSFYVWVTLYPEAFQILYVGLPAILFAMGVPFYLTLRHLWLSYLNRRLHIQRNHPPETPHPQAKTAQQQLTDRLTHQGLNALLNS